MIKEGDIFTNQPLQVSVAKNDHVIQAFASDAANEALTHCVRFGRTYGCPENVDPPVFGYARESLSIFAVVVTDQKAGSFVVRGGFSHLLGNPDVTRCACDAVVHYPARPQLNYEVHEDHAEQQVVGLHKIAGPYFVDMVANKGRPGLPPLDWRQSPTCTSHVLFDRTLVDLDRELEQFALNSFGSPRSIAHRHFFNQRDGFCCDRWPSKSPL